MKKKLLVSTLVAGLLVVTAGAAFAGQVNGVGKTHLGNSMGFNAKDDLTGALEYNGDPNGPQADINAHCDDYDTYKEFTVVDKWKNPGTYPAVRVTSTGCADQQTGQTYKVNAAFVDEGEPGNFDIACIRIYDLDSGQLLVHDFGYIRSGNIQIHLDGSELVETP